MAQSSDGIDIPNEEFPIANHAKDDFLAMLSHEMRTPLNSIMGMLQLSLHSRSRDNIQEYLTVALESSKHLLFLLDDINEVADSCTASLQARLIFFELESTLAPTIALFTAQARNKGLKLICQLDHRLPKRLWGDAGRIRQIIFNLLASVVKQTERGLISVLVNPLVEYGPQERHGLHILIKASDDEEAEKAPKSPEQTAFNAQRNATGTRFGFSIAKYLVKTLGGKLAISPQQGKGIEIQVLLPLHARQEDERKLPAREQGKAALPSEAAKVLVVEDEPINMQTMILSLQLLGCKAIGANSAYKGLSLLRREKFDAVLMDIQMPGLDGLEATRLIRNDTSGDIDAGIPIVAITAHAMQGDKEHILKAGMDEYLAKPVYLEQLQAVLSKILKRPLELKKE